MMNILLLPPNLITLSRLIFTLMMGAYIYVNTTLNPLYLIIYFSLFYWFADAIDGVVARKFNMCTEFGRKLDLFTDRMADLIFCSLLLYLYPVFSGYLILFILIMITYCN